MLTQPHQFDVLDGACVHCGEPPDEVDEEGYCPDREPLTVEVES